MLLTCQIFRRSFEFTIFLQHLYQFLVTPRQFILAPWRDAIMRVTPSIHFLLMGESRIFSLIPTFLTTFSKWTDHISPMSQLMEHTQWSVNLINCMGDQHRSSAGSVSNCSLDLPNNRVFVKLLAKCPHRFGERSYC